jgi:hypothetical protein
MCCSKDDMTLYGTNFATVSRVRALEVYLNNTEAVLMSVDVAQCTACIVVGGSYDLEHNVIRSFSAASSGGSLNYFVLRC